MVLVLEANPSHPSDVRDRRKTRQSSHWTGHGRSVARPIDIESELNVEEDNKENVFFDFFLFLLFFQAAKGITIRPSRLINRYG